MRMWLIVGLIALFMPIAIACASDGGDSEPTATPKPQPSRRGNKLIEGNITFKGVESQVSGATIYVRLEDISIQDDAAKSLVEQVIGDVSVDPSALPTYKYLIEHRELEPKDTYRVRVHLDTDNSGDISEGDFAWTAQYSASMAVGTSVLNAVNVTLEPVATEQTEDTQATVLVEAPITELDIVAADDNPNTYVLKVTSIQPNSCARPNGYEAVRRLRDEDSIDVEIYNVVPASDEIVCAAVIDTAKWDIVIGTFEDPEVTVNVHVNDDAYRLTPGEPPKLEPINAEPPTLSTIRGTIEFVGATEPIAGESLYIRLEDLSRPDLGKRRITERMIPNFSTESSDPGRFRYAIDYQEPRPFGDYGVEVHLDVDGSGEVDRGDYVTTATYSFTGHSPSRRVNVRMNEVE
ncbi:MAG: hypothetical protein OXD46_14665 [Chloroflexi bacterium]|nr:hypothetical protein [Chloroflexota bacterium]